MPAGLPPTAPALKSAGVPPRRAQKPVRQLPAARQHPPFAASASSVAKRVDGGWMIVELGDGQVAGLPARADVSAFYHALAHRLT